MKTKRPPLSIVRPDPLAHTVELTNEEDRKQMVVPMNPYEVQELYEAARAKDAELIQMAVDALMDPHKMSLGRKFLDAALAEGFTPTSEQ